MAKKTTVVRYFLWSLVLLLDLSGCATNRDYLKVHRNFEVDQAFHLAGLEPQFRYYYTGQDVQPTALLALEQDYVLMSEYWHEFKSSYQLRDWVKRMDWLRGEFDDIEYVTINYSGFEVISPENKRIAMLYTKYDWVTAWRGIHPLEIHIPPPQPASIQRPPFFFRRGWD